MEERREEPTFTGQFLIADMTTHAVLDARGEPLPIGLSIDLSDDNYDLELALTTLRIRKDIFSIKQDRLGWNQHLAFTWLPSEETYSTLWKAAFNHYPGRLPSP